MKTIFWDLIFVIVFLAIPSCEMTPEQEKHYEERNEVPKGGDFRTFTFRNHDYIWFTNESFVINSDYKHGGIVHDPDCRKCKVDLNSLIKNENLSDYERIFGIN